MHSNKFQHFVWKYFRNSTFTIFFLKITIRIIPRCYHLHRYVSMFYCKALRAKRHFAVMYLIEHKKDVYYYSNGRQRCWPLAPATDFLWFLLGIRTRDLSPAGNHRHVAAIVSRRRLRDINLIKGTGTYLTGKCLTFLSKEPTKRSIIGLSK